MNVVITIRKADGSRRYYLDGRRISRALFVAIKGDHHLDAFSTQFTETHARHRCCARRIAGYWYH